MKFAVLSDIHAGFSNDCILIELQTKALNAATNFLRDHGDHRLVLNGDTTDHLGNDLSVLTNKQAANDVLGPLVYLIRSKKPETILLAGNTDGLIADVVERKIFFDFTGLRSGDVEIPHGGLLHVAEGDNISLVFTHGHALHPAQRVNVGAMNDETYRELWETLENPNKHFLDAISAIRGSHRRDYLTAVAIGSVVTSLPRIVRGKVAEILGGIFTQKYEEEYARMIAVHSFQTQNNVLGVMGHTHVAGIRAYDGITILNTGTSGAKPNPLQRKCDSCAHLALIDTYSGTFELIQTFNPLYPSAKPTVIGSGNLR